MASGTPWGTARGKIRGTVAGTMTGLVKSSLDGGGGVAMTKFCDTPGEHQKGSQTPPPICCLPPPVLLPPTLPCLSLRPPSLVVLRITEYQGMTSAGQLVGERKLLPWRGWFPPLSIESQ